MHDVEVHMHIKTRKTICATVRPGVLGPASQATTLGRMRPRAAGSPAQARSDGRLSGGPGPAARVTVGRTVAPARAGRSLRPVSDFLGQTVIVSGLAHVPAQAQ